jgi:dTDP-4-dehydrorhamnose reductase
MAGHVIATYLSEQGHDVDTLSASKKLNDRTVLLDATRQSELSDYLSQSKYDAVVNGIGILVRQSESRKDLASYLNGYLPHLLERTFADSSTRVIHLSTDCVFSGQNAPYAEDSDYDGELFYDRSKALGEIINDKDLTFRMSIVGPDMQSGGIGLFNWFYAQSGVVNGFTGAMWSGITTIELARGIAAAIESDLTGLYHLVPSRNISKYELLKLFAETFGRDDISIRPVIGTQVDKTLINTRTDFDFTVKSYSEMVVDMKRWVEAHSQLYPHYRH